MTEALRTETYMRLTEQILAPPWKYIRLGPGLLESATKNAFAMNYCEVAFSAVTSVVTKDKPRLRL